MCALVLTIGAHWALLQSVAWVGMAVRFAQTDPLPEALSKTFDGQHPCQLCKLVANGKQAEKKEATLKAETKLDFLVCARQLVPEAPKPLPVFAPAVEEPETCSASPPTPPPRRAYVSSVPAQVVCA